MPTGASTNRPAERQAAMRERLLDAAARVLVRQGFERTTVRDILAEASVAPNTLYAYFDGKEAILEALTERVVEAVSATVAGAGAADVAQLFDLLLRQSLATQSPADAVMTELRSRSARGDTTLVARINESVVRASRPLMERLCRDGALQADDPDALVELLDIVHDGMARRAASQTFVTSFERVGKVCLDVLAEPTLRPVPGAALDG